MSSKLSPNSQGRANLNSFHQADDLHTWEHDTISDWVHFLNSEAPFKDSHKRGGRESSSQSVTVPSALLSDSNTLTDIQSWQCMNGNDCYSGCQCNPNVLQAVSKLLEVTTPIFPPSPGRQENCAESMVFNETLLYQDGSILEIDIGSHDVESPPLTSIPITAVEVSSDIGDQSDSYHERNFDLEIKGNQAPSNVKTHDNMQRLPVSDKPPLPTFTNSKQQHYTEGPSPSKYCHICGRMGDAQELRVCHLVGEGRCRKVVCEICIQKFDIAYTAHTQSERTPWICTHCRGQCPPNARCAQYAQRNRKRKRQGESDLECGVAVASSDTSLNISFDECSEPPQKKRSNSLASLLN